MKKIRDEASTIILDWYENTGYDYENRQCTDHDKFKKILGSHIFTDKEIILEINKQGRDFFRDNNIKFLDFISPELKNEKELVLELIKANGHNLAVVKKEFKDDEEFVWTAIKSSYNSFCHASERLRDDDAIVDYVLQISPTQIEYTSDRFKNNKELVIELLKLNKTLISRIGEELKSDKDVLQASWNNIKESAVYSGFQLNNFSRVLLENMGEDIKPFFDKINLKLDKFEVVRQMDICFNHLSLSKDLKPLKNIQNKKIKL